MPLVARLTRTVTVAAAGAAAALLFDPSRGRRRRARLAARAGAAGRRARRRASARARYAEGRLVGVRARAAGAGRFTPADDRAIAERIHEVFARCDFATSDVNVDVVDGCATLRGQLGTPEEIRRLRERVADVPGVTRVESFLHLPGTPAPNKQDALRVPSG